MFAKNVEIFILIIFNNSRTLSFLALRCFVWIKNDYPVKKSPYQKDKTQMLAPH